MHRESETLRNTCTCPMKWNSIVATSASATMLLLLFLGAHEMTPEQRLAFSRDVARASSERDKAIVALGLESQARRDPWAVLDGPSAPAAHDDDQNEQGDGKALDGPDNTQAKQDVSQGTTEAVDREHAELHSSTANEADKQAWRAGLRANARSATEYRKGEVAATGPGSETGAAEPEGGSEQ